MATVNSFITFKGKAEKALSLYKEALGGEFLAVMRYGDNPEGENMSEGDKDKISFMVLNVGNGTTIMARDALDEEAKDLIVGDNMYVYINTESKKEVDAIFKKIKEGGRVDMNPQDTPWGGYYCSLVDAFDIPWMINYQQDLGPLSHRP